MTTRHTADCEAKRQFSGALVTLAFLAALLVVGCGDKGPDLSALKDLDSSKSPKEDPGVPAEYVFAFWNVENLFDDVKDGRTKRGDEVYDPYFADDPDALKQKLENLATVIAGMNSGKGPDILCLAEVESPRATELLMKAVNAKLKDEKLHYKTVIFEEFHGGRDIGTPVITRLPVESKRGKILGRKMRIMEARIVVNAHPLVVIASHWSSRISDKDGKTRSKYADQIYGRFRGLFKADPKVDFLVCGDFNDNPDDPSVTDHLHATRDSDDVQRSRDEPKLFHTLAHLQAVDRGTHYYRKFFLFDQICVSPGMLEKEGWSIVPDSGAIIAQIADKRGHPLRFGGPRDKTPLSKRGASDHFPVTLKLRVAAKE